MKLYYTTGACSLASSIIIYELGLKCEHEHVDLRTKITATGANFLSINPKGSVPALLLENNQILTENNIIQQFLCEKYHATHLLPPIDDIQRYRVLEWMNYISTDLHKGSCSLLYNTILTDEIKNSVFKPAFHKKLTFVDHALHASDYLTGNNFTLADANLFVILSWLPDLKIDLSNYSNLSNYVHRIKDRPSIVAALNEERSNHTQVCLT